MKITSGRVVGDHVVPDEPLRDGSLVEIISRDDGDDSFEADPELEAELLESIAEGDRGETISAEEVLRLLKNR